MYYITNQTKQIIAADKNLLELLNVENIDELYSKIALGDITLSLSTENGITISTPLKSNNYEIHESTLSSMLGELTLIKVQVPEEQPVSKDDVISAFGQEENNEEISVVEDRVTPDEVTPLSAPAKTSDQESLELNTAEEDEISLLDTNSLEIKENNEDSITDKNEIAILDDDLIFIKNTDHASEDEISVLNHTFEAQEENEISLMNNTHIKIKNTKENITTDKMENEDELYSLTLSDTPEETIDEISMPTAEMTENDHSLIMIDVQNISQQIGISTKDYNIFLNEYIDTAISLEKDLQSTESKRRSAAIETLLHLSQVLHLPVINKILTQIEHASAEDQNDLIESFYTTLARVTPHQTTTQDDPLLLVPEVESETEPEVEIEETTTKGFGTINLDDVKPIYFDFQAEEAAKDLNLPVELIEEFVRDFIEQAHEETDKMLKAYEEGDLVTIQKIGHLLKGASSNLRIKALSDTLYNIQFCEDSSKLEALIKEYWGHFLSFETQINIISK